MKRNVWREIRKAAQRANRVPAVKVLCPQCGERIILAGHECPKQPKERK